MRWGRLPRRRRTLPQYYFGQARLTTKGLDALNTTVELSGKRGRAGELLASELKEVGKEAQSAAISEIIGRIIGAAAKSFVDT